MTAKELVDDLQRLIDHDPSIRDLPVVCEGDGYGLATELDVTEEYTVTQGQRVVLLSYVGKADF